MISLDWRANGGPGYIAYEAPAALQLRQLYLMRFIAYRFVRLALEDTSVSILGKLRQAESDPIRPSYAYSTAAVNRRKPRAFLERHPPEWQLSREVPKRRHRQRGQETPDIFHPS